VIGLGWAVSAGGDAYLQFGYDARLGSGLVEHIVDLGIVLRW
jgi:hypothetical protein